MTRTDTAPATGGRPLLASVPDVGWSAERPAAIPRVEVVALPVLMEAGEPVLGPGAADLGTLLEVDLLAVLESSGGSGEVGQVTQLPIAAPVDSAPELRLVLLVGCGAGRGEDCRKAGAALARAVRRRGVVATTIAALDPDAVLAPLVAGLVLGSFTYELRSVPGDPPAQQFVLAGLAAEDAPAVDRAVAAATASWGSRALAATPANVCSPQWLAEQAVETGERGGLEVTVWDEKRLAEDGFGGVLGIGRASASPPRLIRMDYTPSAKVAGRRARSRRPVVLVGKGVTFDSGGLSIKPGEAMASMKRDMTGGGTVIAAMGALAAIGCPVPVVGLVPAVENAIAGNALRPGDVVRHYGGRTTEVTNTDAEGRVILADALAYAVSELDPAVIVDVATLTGAVKVALGQQVGGLFSNDDTLAQALRDAGERSGEPLWRLPLAATYEERIASRVADSDNAGGGPGAITAALFLQHFVAGRPWAHLDIASVGDAPGEDAEWSKGPTGFGVRVLLDWLGGPDPVAGISTGDSR